MKSKKQQDKLSVDELAEESFEVPRELALLQLKIEPYLAEPPPTVKVKEVLGCLFRQEADLVGRLAAARSAAVGRRLADVKGVI